MLTSAELPGMFWCGGNHLKNLAYGITFALSVLGTNLFLANQANTEPFIPGTPFPTCCHLNCDLAETCQDCLDQCALYCRWDWESRYSCYQACEYEGACGNAGI